MIDGQVEPLGIRPTHQFESLPLDDDIEVGRQDINRVGFHRHVVFDLPHGHGGGPSHQLAQLALVPWIEVQHHDKGHAGVDRQMFEEIHDRFEPPGGSAHSHDWERQASIGHGIAREVVRGNGGSRLLDRLERFCAASGTIPGPTDELWCSGTFAR